MKLLYAALLVSLLSLATGCTTESTTPGTVTGGSEDATAKSGTETAAIQEPAADAGQPAADAQKQQIVESKPSSDLEDETVTGTFEAADLPDDLLTIGSKAPSLDIEHWVSDGNGAFQAVTEFAPGKIYVVEFWATWCGPCVQSMPHLVELQNQHKDDVQVISVSDEDLETVNGFLARPYPDGGEEGPKTFGELTSAYCLTTDPDRTTGNAYMRAAGQNGIPACFVVGKTGLIEWIGHPMRLDEPISKVIDGSWDREAFGVAFKKAQLFDKVMREVFTAAQGGDMEKAYQMLAKAKELASEPQQKMQVQSIEMQLKLAPIAKKMQDGDVEGAIADLEALLEKAEGPLKDQIDRILSQVKEQVEAAAEEATEEGDDAEPADEN